VEWCCPAGCDADALTSRRSSIVSRSPFSASKATAAARARTKSAANANSPTWAPRQNFALAGFADPPHQLESSAKFVKTLGNHTIVRASVRWITPPRQRGSSSNRQTKICRSRFFLFSGAFDSRRADALTVAERRAFTSDRIFSSTGSLLVDALRRSTAPNVFAANRGCGTAGSSRDTEGVIARPIASTFQWRARCC
jgi:hypothetical protein